MESQTLPAFDTLSLSDPLKAAIVRAGYTRMTPIQAACIPVALDGDDLIGQSQTGSGKTAAFVLPILERIELGESRPQALILCPTRELSDQVLREVRKFSSGFKDFRTVATVGGQEFTPQLRSVMKGAHLIVGTPGRTLELLEYPTVDFSRLKVLVLDEADRMLEAGFADEMTKILERLPTTRQTMFFSATYPEQVEGLSRRFQKNPRRITVADLKQTAPNIQQFVYAAENPEKEDALLKILAAHPSKSTIVFCRTKATVKSLGEKLTEARVSVQVLHGDLEQNERDRVTSMFRAGSVRVLIATDIAARGLDIDVLELVVNVDLPPNAETYVHRIGRTGRAGRKGTAVSLATAYEAGLLEEIESMTGAKLIRGELGANVPKGFSASMRQSATKTIQLSGGRNDKLRPGDILGALTGPPKPLAGTDIGKIEIRERFSFIAVDSSKAQAALEKLNSVKIKGSKFKAYLVD